MAQNLTGHVTTAKRGDTFSEHLTANSLTGANRFQSLRTAMKMTNAGSPKWIGLRATLGGYGFVLRHKLVQLINAKN